MKVIAGLLLLLSASTEPLTGELNVRLNVRRDGLALHVAPGTDPLAMRSNALWADWGRQATPTPPIVEGLFTLYGYSELAYGVACLRAAEYTRLFGLGQAVRHEAGERYVRLCGSEEESVDGFRARLNAEGYDCVVALKADDVGRSGVAWWWDDEADVWLGPLRILVLDSLGDGWERLSQTTHPFEGHTDMTWVGDVAKDCLERVGLGRLVEANRSGFMRLLLDDAAGRAVEWPEYELRGAA